MYDYDRNLLPNAHLRSLEEGVTNIEQAQEKTRYTIGYPGWGLIYHLLLCHLARDSEQIIIETGSNEGCTSIILAQALADSGASGHLHTIELDKGFAEKADHNLKQAGLSEYATIHLGHSHEVLASLVPNLVSRSGPLRSVFLDASHLYDDVMTEFHLIREHLADDALVIFDNTYRIAEANEDQRVNGALKTIMKEFGGNLINLEQVSWYTPGLAIWQKKPKL